MKHKRVRIKTWAAHQMHIYILIFVFALFDALSTMCFLHFGLAREVNPFMDGLLSLHPALFATVKLTLTGLVVGWLYKWRSDNRAKVVAYGTMIFYGFICALHCTTYLYYGGS